MHLKRRHFLAASGAAFLSGPALAATQAYQIPPQHQARIVRIKARFEPGEIHVDPGQFALYWTLPGRRAVRYPVGIGRPGLYESGTFTVGRKAEWPRWTPTKAMIEREPDKYKKYEDGMEGGPNNPLGARALYLYSGSRDTLLRIHGTPQPHTMGTRQSNGCVRMINAHAIDLYERVPSGTRVVLH
ncbi:L,D-transpeptidase [Sulfitobacter sediminis]|uniref:L,D-transpeptidase n=1 Tax=Sulfitobacter sediminis TaxID=3234186 RepID=UPI003B22325D